MIKSSGLIYDGTSDGQGRYKEGTPLKIKLLDEEIQEGISDGIDDFKQGMPLKITFPDGKFMKE